MALTETRPETEATPPEDGGRPAPGSLERLIGTGDHTSTGRLFIGFSLILLVVGLVVRTLVGIEVATDNGFLGERTGMLTTSTLVGVVLLGVVPLLLGLAIHMVPLQVASPSIAFPRAAALSLWTWLLSGVVFITSVALDGGIGGADGDAAKLGNVSMGAMMVALALGAVCVATTVVAHRPFGMGLARVPMFSWSMLVASVLWIATFASALAHVIVGQISQADAAKLATNFADGIAWMLRGPSIYVLAIPLLGIAADVVATATGRRLPAYGIMQTLVGAFAVLSFGAWSQTPASVNTAMWALIALATFVPVVGLLGGLADGLRRGPVNVNGAVVGSLLGLLLLLGAVACGVLQAVDTIGKGSLMGLSTAALVAAQAWFVIGAALCGALAGLFHWSVKVWGGEAGATGAQGSAALVFLGGGLLGTAQLVQSIVQRDGGDSADQLFGVLVALGALLVLLGVLGALANAMTAAREGGAGGPVDPHDGLTLEWAGPSPSVGDAIPDDLPEVTSPYPLLDAREGEKESK